MERPPKLVTDTSDSMRIIRGNVLRADGRDFVIKGNRYETRFGIADQPKYWVFGAIDLDSGEKKIIKTVFHEDFNVHIGVFKIRCYRSPEKEAQVLERVKGDSRFMQGYTIEDEKCNCIRILDYIPGMTIFNYVYSINKPHRQYFQEDLPGILHNLAESMEAIKFLHDNDFCHGDIRNDHIIIETGTGHYRWIDFDLQQHVSDFDVWSMGNILCYVAGKGINSFKLVLKSREFSGKVKKSLVADDGSAFYEYRIMNLKKLYSYIPEKFNNILLHFTLNPIGHYAAMEELLDDYYDMLDSEFPAMYKQ
ncbi:MAG: hypothetical protein V3V99_07990 [candidate division Zixibacteria bacterium]